MDQVREIVKHWSPTKLARLWRALGENPADKVSNIISKLRLFRDPPSKEDLECFLQELTIQVGPSIRVEASRIWSICHSFWESALSDLKKIPRYGAWRTQYLDGKEHVCTFGSASSLSLLWTALDRPSRESEDYASRIFDQSMMHLAVILGASGVGKTRTILEWGLERNCIILTGHVESTARGYWGSRDVLAVAKHMLKLFGTDKPITNDAAVSCCVGALLIARFYIWQKCKEARPEIANYDWMCLQLEFFNFGVKDIFELLTVDLMNAFVLEGEEMQWEEVSKMFWHMVEELQMKMDWNGFIAIEECQEVNKYLSNRFASVTLGQGQRSILNPLLVELSKCPRTRAIVVSGTGATLLELNLAFQSGSAKQRLHYSEVLGFKGFESKIEIETYANRFVDIHQLDMGKIWSIYRGRYRFFVTALERYMSHQCTGGTQFFVDFATLLSTSTGAKLQLF